MRAIGYARVSKADRRKGKQHEAHSIEAQRQAIRRAAEYNGWELLETCVDNGKSGTNTRRDGLQQALAMLKRGDADMLVIAKYDRLSRSTADFTSLIDQSVKEGWALAVLDQRVDTSTAVGKYMARIMAANAELERDLISERTRDALAVVKANGTQLGKPSTIPQAVQRRIMQLHNSGVSASEIARRLSNSKHDSPSGNAHWDHSTVARLIKRMNGAAA